MRPSPKQDAALEAIAAGRATTTTDLRRVLHHMSTSATQSVVRQLERKGLVKRAGTARTLDKQLGEFGRIRRDCVVYTPTEAGRRLVESWGSGDA